MLSIIDPLARCETNRAEAHMWPRSFAGLSAAALRPSQNSAAGFGIDRGYERSGLTVSTASDPAGSGRRSSLSDFDRVIHADQFSG